MEQLDKKELMKEHREIHDIINIIINKAKVSSKAIKEIRDRAKIIVKEAIDCGGRSYHYSRYSSGKHDITTEVGRKNKLLDYSTCKQNWYGNSLKAIDIGNANLRGSWDAILDLLQSQMIRQECLIELVDNYLNLDPIQADADSAAVEARRAYQRIQTGFPYGWSVNIMGKPGKGKERKFTWKQNKNSRYDRTKGGYVDVLEHMPRVTWYVDETYMDTVHKYKIHTTDIAGKKCFVKHAELITGHELESQDVKLFKAVVGYTKVPVDFDSWGSTRVKSKADIRACIFNEERWIAVQELPDGRREQASGKDQSWAIRTMKQRMKSTMLRTMGLK